MKLLIVDDHPIMRLGIRQLILGAWPDAELEETETLEAACRKVLGWRPDVVLLDLVMPDVAGTEGASRMLAVAGATPVLVLSSNPESAFAGQLLKMGVAGYVPKDRAGEELVTALRCVLQGRRYVTAAMADRLVDVLGGRVLPQAPHETLSIQEHRVMLLIADGTTPAAIAAAMGLSVKTVGTYRSRIFEKTGWKTNAELAKYCLQHGLSNAG